MESSDDPGSLPRRNRILYFISSKLNPRKSYSHIKAIIKKHGLVIGVAAAGFELAEHFVVPGILAHLFGAEYLLVAGLPLGEIVVYPLLFNYLSG